MKRSVKNYKDFLTENTEVMPEVKPRTKPSTRPNRNRPSPVKKDRPSVNPKPKASAEELADKFLGMVSDDKEVMELLKNKYNN